MSVAAALENQPAGKAVLAAACVSAFVVNANTSAVTILLPTMSEDVGASVDTLQWAVTGYMLVGAAVIVTSGALGDVLGRRRVFLAGLLLFVASCALIALSDGSTGIIAGRMIQGAAGSTILACGMSLLSVASSGTGEMRAITVWGAASAGGAAAGPLVGGLLVELSGWQGLFWIDAIIAGLCIPLTLLQGGGVARSEPLEIDRLRRHRADRGDAGTPWCSRSARAATGAGRRRHARLPPAHRRRAVAFVVVEGRVAAPLVDLALLRNAILVGATLAILIVAGTINALMYVLSLYFQDPAGFGMSALKAGVATLPAAAAMIAITPLITPLAVKIGTRLAIAGGFGLAAVGFAALAFVEASWTYAVSSSRWRCSPQGSASPTGRRRRPRPRWSRKNRSGRHRGSRTWRATSADRSGWPPSPRSTTG